MDDYPLAAPPAEPVDQTPALGGMGGGLLIVGLALLVFLSFGADRRTARPRRAASGVPPRRGRARTAAEGRRSPSPSIFGPAEAKARRVRARGKTVRLRTRQADEELTSRLMSGRVGGEELKRLIAEGVLDAGQQGRRRNPPLPPATRAAVRRALPAARALNGQGSVIVLDDRERRPPPRVLLPVGKLEEITYRAPPGEKAGPAWVHKAHDRGALNAPAEGETWLAAEPTNGRLHVVNQGEGMRLSGRWLIG